VRGDGIWRNSEKTKKGKSGITEPVQKTGNHNLTIQTIEPFPGLGDGALVFHISLIGTCLKKPGLQPLISHAPVLQESLDASVTHPANAQADFLSADAGITRWREDKRGVFTLPVADVVSIIDDVSAS